MGKLVFAALLTALGAVLLMSVQPLASKDCLPLLGGTPAVWAIALVFFQATLLAGYGLAIPLARASRGPRTIALVSLLAVALSFLPPRIEPEALTAAMGESWPWWPLTWSLTRGFFLPVLVVGMSAPLIQAWLAKSRPGLDPTPLYAASNTGSLLGLMAYPLLLEPLLDLGTQRQVWSYGHVFWCLGMLFSSWWFRPVPSQESFSPDEPLLASWRSHPWGTWLLASAFPSMLMVAMTTHLVTDVAGAPLLGILPLALYLVSFILAFGGASKAQAPAWLPRAQVLAALVLALLWGVGSVEVRGGLALPLLVAHLAGFLLVTWGTHRRLVETRPAPEGLPWFYLALSVGGVLGGITAALLAPILLSRAGIWEYPIALAGCCLFQAGGPTPWKKGDGFRVALASSTAIALAGLAWSLQLGPGGPRWALIVGLPLLLAHLGSFRPGLHASLLAIALLVAKVAPDPTGKLIWQERSFFGMARVELTGEGRADQAITRLVHGGTIHGQACPAWRDGRGQVIPLGYYHPRGPTGDLLGLPSEALPRKRVAAIGLGVGALAYYARPNEEWTFLEIDPLMEKLARRKEWFPYLDQSSGKCSVRLGDGRLLMAREPEAAFDLIILDAFSSDSIPAHLLTREAMEIYKSKLAPGGRLLVHISNRYLELLPVVSGMAAEAGMAVHSWWDATGPGPDSLGAKGWMASHWALLGDLPKGLRGPWIAPASDLKPVHWTDSHAALLPLLRLGGAAD
jgi:hypothetical protein